MAQDITIYVRATRRQVLAALRQLPALTRGSSVAAKTLLVRCGLAALWHIRKAFIQKAAGGADASGLRWPPLSINTIAYSRPHKRHFRPGGAYSANPKSNIPKKPTRAGYAPSWMLTKKQRERWWAVYGSGLATYAGDKAHAAAVAWIILKAEGATTIRATYGTLKVLTLRDTGLLLNSLTPGVAVGAVTAQPPKVAKQVFTVGRGEVIIGTNRQFAGTHHRGVPGHIPQRRLWPEPSRWPANWWRDVATQARAGVIDIVLWLFRRSP